MGEILFWLFASTSVLSAFLVVTRKNPIYSAVFLILSFLSVAGVLVLLDAPVLAGLHVLVYGGAIMVLFLFTIMLLNLRPHEFGGEAPLPTKLVLGALAAALFAVLAFAFSGQDRPLPEIGSNWSNGRDVGKQLFDTYLLPFELVTVLILIAVFGSLVLAKRTLPEKP